eukprot:m.408487 g.408487  ORF g.408487 m.408487 type:complete len:286 (+) comp28451_c0_seq4:207-1064(+)
MSLAEIKDKVAQSLVKKGILPKLQAEVRAAVFHDLKEQGYTIKNNPQREPARTNARLTEFAETTDGRLVLNLVREFLEHFELGFTDSVLVPEAGIDGGLFPGRELLASEIPGACIASDPLLISLLASARHSSSKNDAPAGRHIDTTPRIGFSRDGTTAAPAPALGSAPVPAVNSRGTQKLTGVSNFRRLADVGAVPTALDMTPTQSGGGVDVDSDRTPLGSEHDISEEYSEDFDSEPDDETIGGLPFTTGGSKATLDDEDGTEDLSINSGQTDFDYDYAEDVPEA